MSDERITLVTDKNYVDFLDAQASVVVFGIVPCQLCEEYDPIVREVAEKYDGSVRFGKAKLHVPGACREIKRKYRFESFPTTHFYREGNLVHKVEGKLDHPTLTKTIKQVLLNSSP